MEVTQLTAVQLAVLTAIVVGATEFITRLRAKDLWVAATIFTAAVIGGLVFWYYGADFVSGVPAGLAASGFVAIGSKFGNKSVPTESSVLK